MASPFAIRLLPPSVRQAFPSIEGGVARGLSINKITLTIREAGIRTSQASVGQAVRLVKRLQMQEARVASRTINRPVNVNNLPRSLTKIARDFSFRVQLQLRNPFTNEIQKKYITVSTDEANLTPNEIVSRAEEIVSEIEHYEESEVLGGKFQGGVRSVDIDF